MAVRYGFTDEELKERVMELWRLYAKKYREVIPKYLDLIEKKRALKMVLHRVPKYVLSEMVIIPFFDCATEQDAEMLVSAMSRSEVVCLISTIDTAVNGYCFQTLLARVRDYEYELAHHNTQKCPFGYDPNYPYSAGGRSRKSSGGKNNE